MRLLMVSGDRQVAIGRRGPFHAMQAEFSRYFERVDVLCPRPDGEVVVRTIHDNVHFHTAPCGRPGMARWIGRRGAELVREQGSALVVSHDYGWFYNGLGSARIHASTGVPYLSELHHVPGHPVPADLRERFDKRVARTYVRWAMERACAFRVVNRVEMPELLRSWGVPAEMVRVLPSLYMDLSVFHPPEDLLEPERDVIFVGRMVNNKGLGRLVEALARLARGGRPTTALLLGQGPLRAATERRVAAAGLADAVEFRDWVDRPADLAQLYRTSRVAVCASTCEGGPRVTVEAMACGTPAVSTRVGVMGELLADGAGGRLVDFTADGLAAGLAEVLGDEERRRAMGRAARATAARFEYAAVLRGYAEGLHALAAEFGPGSGGSA